jgi:putative MATE family efflux protein
VLATVAQGLFNIVDTFWVGRGLGPAALAGVSTAGFAVWLVLSVAELPAVGLTAVASRRYGERDAEAAARTVYDAFWLGLVVALLLGVFGLLGLPVLFAIMGTPVEVTEQGAGYLAVYLVGAPVVLSYFVMDAAFRAVGDTRTPLNLLMIALGLNFILDPLLILGIGPFPRLGIQGAALATLLTRSATCVVGYRWLVRRGLIRRGVVSAAVVRQMARIGLPVAVGGAGFSMIYILLTRITSQFGTPALAALGVGHKVESMGYMVCVGFGLAAATAVGQNLGAGSTQRAESAGRIATGYALIVMGVLTLAFLVMPEALMRLFTTDAAVIEAGGLYLRIVAAAQIFMAFELVLQMAMDGAGYTVTPMVASVTLTTARLPLAVLLAVPFGLTGIWWTISATAIARGVAVAWIWHRGRWKLREV